RRSGATILDDAPSWRTSPAAAAPDGPAHYAFGPTSTPGSETAAGVRRRRDGRRASTKKTEPIPETIARIEKPRRKSPDWSARYPANNGPLIVPSITSRDDAPTIEPKARRPK